jgi:uncharacterized protein (TIGR03083 family)
MEQPFTISYDAALAGFRLAAREYVALVATVPDDRWDEVGLGDWDVRSLVGHTGRSFITVVTYLGQPVDHEAVPTAAAYFAAIRSAGSDDDAIRLRGVEAGRALGPEPAAAVAELAAEANAALAAVDGDHPVMTTAAGGMRLSSYLPTRTFELTVHGLDLAKAVGASWTPPELALAQSLAVAAEAALLLGAGAPVLLSLTGRGSLTADQSVVG